MVSILDGEYRGDMDDRQGESEIATGERTDIVKHAVALYHWTLINVTYTKQPLSEKSISEGIS